MSEKEDKRLRHRMSRELRVISRDEKLRYAALAALGLPLLVLVNIVFVLRVIDLFRSSSILGFIGLLAFTLVIGLAALGADFWLFRWLIDEFRVFRWGSREKSTSPDRDE